MPKERLKKGKRVNNKKGILHLVLHLHLLEVLLRIVSIVRIAEDHTQMMKLKAGLGVMPVTPGGTTGVQDCQLCYLQKMSGCVTIAFNLYH